jgi:hypothetical protein
LGLGLSVSSLGCHSLQNRSNGSRESFLALRKRGRGLLELDGLLLVDNHIRKGIAVFGIEVGSIELTKRGAVLIHLRLLAGSRGSSRSNSNRSARKFNSKLGGRDVFLSTAITGSSLALVIADIQNSRRVLHKVGHLILLGVDVDIKEPRGRGLGRRLGRGGLESGSKRERTSDSALAGELSAGLGDSRAATGLAGLWWRRATSRLENWGGLWG